MKYKVCKGLLELTIFAIKLLIKLAEYLIIRIKKI